MHGTGPAGPGNRGHDGHCQCERAEHPLENSISLIVVPLAVPRFFNVLPLQFVSVEIRAGLLQGLAGGQCAGRPAGAVPRTNRVPEPQALG